MRYMIAVDSGGTKSDTVLFQEDGHVLCRDISLGCNPLDIGENTARNRMIDILRRVSAKSPETVSAAFAGIAGTPYFDAFFDSNTCKAIHVEKFRFDTDGRSLISTELSHEEDGCCLICGTGCGLWIRKKELGHLVRRGGWGYLIDTLGSGYILGRDAFRAACFAEEDRGEPTVLTELITKELGKPIIPATVDLYAGGRRLIASLAHTVFDGYRMGDAVCRRILEAGAGDMSGLVWAADKFFQESYTVVMGGGILFSFPEYVEAIQQRAPARANLILASAPPVYGAAVEAMHDCGLTCGKSFRDTFLHDYKQLCQNGGGQNP